MDFTRWIPMSELYQWQFSQTPEQIWVTRVKSASALLGQAGIYMIADSSLAGAWPGSTIIYVGSSGGRGAGSTFHDRVHKHALKAMNATGNGISDTELWRQYRDDRGLATAPIATWIVRFLVLPNATAGERAAIRLAEDAIALAFDRRHHVGAQRITMPRCNSQSLGNRLLRSVDGLLDAPQQGATPAAVAAVAQAPVANPAVQRVANVVAPVVPAQPASAEEPLTAMDQVPDDDLFDEQFERRVGPVLAEHYPALLAGLQAECESHQGRAVGLQVYYTNTGGRDLRVGWDVDATLSVLLVIGSSKNRFFGFTRAPKNALPPDLLLQDVGNGAFRRYRAGGAEFASNVGKLLRAALVWASVAYRR